MTKQEFMAMSLPYGLKFILNESMNVRVCTEICASTKHYVGHVREHGVVFNIDFIKPIVRPISDISIEIEHRGEKLIPITKILEQSCFDVSKMTYMEQCSYIKGFIDPLELLVLQDAILLLKWNFDIAGLIDKGEAIDYHTLEGFSF